MPHSLHQQANVFVCSAQPPMSSSAPSSAGLERGRGSLPQRCRRMSTLSVWRMVERAVSAVSLLRQERVAHELAPRLGLADGNAAGLEFVLDHTKD